MDQDLITEEQDEKLLETQRIGYYQYAAVEHPK